MPRATATALFPAVPIRAREELAAVLALLEVDPRRVTPVASDPPWRPPRAHRVVAADGRELKVRIGQDARLAARSALLAERLDDPALAAPIVRVGRVTAERWVDGTVLSEGRVLDRHLRDAAALLARIHRFPGVPGERLPQRRRLGPLVERVHRQTADLIHAGLLTARHAERVQGILADVLPDAAPWGLVHSDICPENLVVRPDGALVSIDNERLGRGFAEVDLARTWYRWPMPERRWTQLEDAYRGRAHGFDADERRAWRVLVVVRTLHMRWRHRASADGALAALRDLLSTEAEVAPVSRGRAPGRPPRRGTR